MELNPAQELLHTENVHSPSLEGKTEQNQRESQNPAPNRAETTRKILKNYWPIKSKSKLSLHHRIREFNQIFAVHSNGCAHFLQKIKQEKISESGGREGKSAQQQISLCLSLQWVNFFFFLGLGKGVCINNVLHHLLVINISGEK